MCTQQQRQQVASHRQAKTPSSMVFQRPTVKSCLTVWSCHRAVQGLGSKGASWSWRRVNIALHMLVVPVLRSCQSPIWIWLEVIYINITFTCHSWRCQARPLLLSPCNTCGNEMDHTC